MDLVLNRLQTGENGVISKIIQLKIYTAEHAYPSDSFELKYPGLDRTPGRFVAKIPNGLWTCVRGIHKIGKKLIDIETFEVLVPGHTGLLFHPGNKPQEDSNGCVLPGTDYTEGKVIYSKQAFQKLMDAQKGIDKFSLLVVGP